MQFDDGSLNWGLIVFLGLLLAVVPLWCHVIRAAARLSCCARRRQPRVQEQFLASATQPLLGHAFLQPLAPEKPMAERPCPVEVRSFTSCAPCLLCISFHILHILCIFRYFCNLLNEVVRIV